MRHLSHDKWENPASWAAIEPRSTSRAARRNSQAPRWRRGNGFRSTGIAATSTWGGVRSSPKGPKASWRKSSVGGNRRHAILGARGSTRLACRCPEAAGPTRTRHGVVKRARGAFQSMQIQPIDAVHSSTLRHRTRQGERDRLPSQAADLFALGQLAAEPLCQRLRSSLAGLTCEEAACRLQDFGLNLVARERKPTILQEIRGRAKNPLNALLLTLAAVSYFIGDMRAAIVIVLMVLLA